jgi:DeoR-like helix-turn-helix domain
MTFAELQAVIPASPATIRRDLGELEKSGELIRVHGGVMDTRYVRSEITFDERMLRNVPAKRAIAALAATLIPPGASVHGESSMLMFRKDLFEETGWATVPPGTRKSTYENPEYQKAAPFAAVTLQAMQTADPTNPAIRPVPYKGVQFVGIPEFQSFGTVVGQQIAGALAGKMTVDAALKASQAAANKAVKQAGLQK